MQFCVKMSYEYTRTGIIMNKNIIAEFVREQRRRAGLTQTQLAGKAGVGLRFVRDLEQGKSSLRMDTVNKVLFLFGRRLGAIDLPKSAHLKPGFDPDHLSEYE